MNRKQFLRRSALFSLAVAGLPRIAGAFQTKAKEDYYKKTTKKPGGGEQVFKTHFQEAVVVSPDEADNIRIVLEATFYTGYSFAADADATSQAGRYTLQRIGTPTTEGSYTIIKWKLLPKVDGKDVLKGKFQKTVVSKLRSKRHLIFEMADNESMQLDYENPDESAYDDCFLTTACTAARGLPDDCAELTTLRMLRDVHMKPTAEGSRLIAEYYSIAPGIVAEVNTRDNRQEIWDLVYSDLVQPVVALTDAGGIDEAIAHYSAYTGWMNEAFGKGSLEASPIQTAY